MENRTKLELELNSPRTLELLFDQPMIGESRYGAYYLYALVDPDTGEEVSFFSPPDVHEILTTCKRGDRFTITKTAEQQGKKVVTTFKVELHTNGHAAPANGKSGNGSAEPTKQAVSDTLFDVMLKSYEDAIRMQERLNGMVDVNRIAITLFIARSKMNGNGVYA